MTEDDEVREAIENAITAFGVLALKHTKDNG